MISNFALTHFSAAKHFSEQTRRIEDAQQGDALGNFFEEISIYVSAAIVSASSSLEALINELFLQPGPLQDAVEDFDSFFWGKGQENGLERKPPLSKYRKAVNLLGMEPISRLDQPYQRADALLGFRNYLVHFKPLWDDERRQESLEEALDGQFSLSPFVDDTANFLAMRCMSHGCTEWAVSSAKDFISYFAERTELDPKKLGAFQ